MGSDSDLEVMKGAVDVLNDFGIENEVLVLSAHRTFEATREYAMSAIARGTKVFVPELVDPPICPESSPPCFHYL